MASKIPVRIETVEEADGGVEVFLKLDDFMSTGASFLADIRAFKASYL